MGGLDRARGLALVYTLVASKLDQWWITAPMVFVAAGAVLAPAG